MLLHMYTGAAKHALRSKQQKDPQNLVYRVSSSCASSLAVICGCLLPTYGRPSVWYPLAVHEPFLYNSCRSRSSQDTLEEDTHRLTACCCGSDCAHLQFHKQGGLQTVSELSALFSMVSHCSEIFQDPGPLQTLHSGLDSPNKPQLSSVLRAKMY